MPAAVAAGHRSGVRRSSTAHSGGFSLVEIVFAAAIISFSLISIIAITSQSVVFSHRSLNTYTAATLLEEGAEVARIVRDNNWTSVEALAPAKTYYPAFLDAANTWVLSTDAKYGTVGVFTRTVTVAPAYRDKAGALAPTGTADENARLVTVTVSWNENGKTEEKVLSLYLINIFS